MPNVVVHHFTDKFSMQSASLLLLVTSSSTTGTVPRSKLTATHAEDIQQSTQLIQNTRDGSTLTRQNSAECTPLPRQTDIFINKQHVRWPRVSALTINRCLSQLHCHLSVDYWTTHNLNQPSKIKISSTVIWSIPQFSFFQFSNKTLNVFPLEQRALYTT